MIFINAYKAMIPDPSCLSMALLLLTAYVLYLIYAKNNKSPAADRRRLISQIPSLTNNAWTTLSVWLELGSLRPRDILPFCDSVLKQYGSVVNVQLFTRQYVLINNPDDIKILLSSAQHIEKGPDYKMIKPWLKTGLLTSTGQKWHSRRKLLTNTFHFKILETYMPSINKNSRSLVKKLITAYEDSRKPIADIESYVTLCALDIAGETIMGVNLRTQEGKSADFVKTIKNITKIVTKRAFTFWYWNDTVFYLSKMGKDFRKYLKSLHEYTENVIKERRKILENSEHNKKNEENGKKRVLSFLDLLIGICKENPGAMTDEDIREEVDTFLFAGHDTSSIVLTMAIIHLGLNQNIQDSVRDELYEIFGDNDRDVTIEDLKAMPTLERVIKETLRLYPSVSVITRIIHEPLHLTKYTIPAESTIIVTPYFMHRIESIYPDPERFDPDRFTPEQCAVRHPFAYIPFSAGPRNCIGQKFGMYQMKIVLSTILRHARLETIGKKSDIILSFQMILRADQLPSVKVTPV